MQPWREKRPGPIGAFLEAKKNSFDRRRFAASVRANRRAMSLREAANEIGMSFSTLDRIERGALPSVEIYLRVCDWLERAPGEFFVQNQEQHVVGQDEKPKRTIVEQVEIALRTKDLELDLVEALIVLLNHLIEN